MSEEKNLKNDHNDTLGDAKESMNEFADDAKETFNTVSSDGKNVAIIAHITIIGWIIALIMNNGNKTQIGSFYIRQVLGLGLIGVVTGWIPIVGWIIALIVLVLWIMSLIGALSGEEKLTPVLGEHFQNWFSSL